MKYGWTRYTSSSLRYKDADGQPKLSYGISLWAQPWHRWLIAEMYHWYSMKIFKVPGFRKLEKWLWNHYEKTHSADHYLDYIPISNRQDLRCDYLQHKQRKVLATLDLTKEQFDGIRKDHGG